MRSINEGDAEDFKLFLINKELASTTVHKRLQFARQFFRDALRRKLIENNPFADVSAKAVTDTDRQHFIPREDIGQLLDVCNPTWHLITILSRYGGLRCPSEVLSLLWEDVNWQANRIVVRSPKTKRYGKAMRTIPMFPELQLVLSEAFEQAEDGAQYVVGGGYRKAALTPSGWRNCNLRTQFERLLKRAGLQPWPRLFHNLRASRETELASEYPIHVVTAWMGNTPRIAMKHYLQVTDDDFQKAIVGAESGALDAKAVQNPVQHAHAKNRTHLQATVETPSKTGIFATGCDSTQICAKE
jgi:integrase